MTLSSNDRKEIRENLNDSQKYIMEKLSGDRKAHSLHFLNIEGKIEDLKDGDIEIKDLLKKLYLQSIENGSSLEILTGKHNVLSDSVASLKDYHDNDLKPIKENLMFRVGKNKYVFWAITAVFLFSFWKEAIHLVNGRLVKEGIDTPIHIEYVNQKPRTRGGFIEYPKDTLNDE